MGRLYPGGEGTPIFSYIRRLESFFGVQHFEYQYLLGFPKNEYFGGYEKIVDTFFFGGGGSSQNWTILVAHFCIFR